MSHTESHSDLSRELLEDVIREILALEQGKINGKQILVKVLKGLKSRDREDAQNDKPSERREETVRKIGQKIRRMKMKKIVKGTNYCISDSPFEGSNGNAIGGKPWLFFYGTPPSEPTLIRAGKDCVAIGGLPYDTVRHGGSSPMVLAPGQAAKVRLKNSGSGYEFAVWEVELLQ